MSDEPPIVPPTTANEDGSGDDPLDAEARRLWDEDDEGGAPLDDVEVRDLLRRALRDESASDDRSVLHGVQRRLRAETGGRYFADGWGTTPRARETYLVTAVLLVVLLGFAWLALGPLGIRRL